MTKLLLLSNLQSWGKEGFLSPFKTFYYIKFFISGAFTHLTVHVWRSEDSL